MVYGVNPSRKPLWHTSVSQSGKNHGGYPRRDTVENIEF